MTIWQQCVSASLRHGHGWRSWWDVGSASAGWAGLDLRVSGASPAMRSNALLVMVGRWWLKWMGRGWKWGPSGFVGTATASAEAI